VSQLTITLIRFGLLALLWIFVFSIVGVLRSDIYGTRVSRRSQRRRGTPAPEPPAQPSRDTPARGQPPAGRQAPTSPPAAAENVGSHPGSLTVTSGALAGTSVPLRAAGVVIGRNPECALVLTDDYASGRHVKVYATTDGWYAEDLGSTNGTLLDGTRMAPNSPQPIRQGTEITVGRTTIQLRG
jgi:pSer/pThr/pTyr-binding forkhead associated (FHA) protein